MGVKCRVWRVERGVYSVECGVGVRRVKCKVWSVEFKVSSVKCRM